MTPAEIVTEWERGQEIDMDTQGRLLDIWFGFAPGTHHYDVWRWVDEHYPPGVNDLLKRGWLPLTISEADLCWRCAHVVQLHNRAICLKAKGIHWPGVTDGLKKYAITACMDFGRKYKNKRGW